MVDDELTDGRRIAQLLASEVTGRTDGLLGDLSVVDADPDARPTAAGTFAFAIVVRDGGGGGSEATRRVGAVEVTPGAAVLDLAVAVDPGAAAHRDDVRWLDEDRRRLAIERGAAVKPAVDLLRAAAGEAVSTGRDR